MKRAWILSVLLFAGYANAGIQLASTRVIYPAGKREVTLAVTSKDPAPRLIQTWIENDSADTAKVPFIILPPIFRLNPDKGQTLRIIHTGGAVPQDRESVFWLNVLEIPPKPAGKADHIQLTVRSRLKLFYRPTGLAGSPKAAVTQLRWRLVQNNQGYALECENPSAFTVSFNHVGLTDTVKSEHERQSGMCPARGRQRFAVRATPAQLAGGRLFFTTIDDYGGQHHHQAAWRR
ncbi:fimbrial chaperone [Enterobacter hormaechei]|uniref:Molecular chaperone n=1 Tax=Phytobacter ursingii TaxID=1972431 RepID=A0AB35RTB9_9ENTR|nr:MULTISPECIES: molecular chaperone [Enterobacteriaceae]MDV2864012.1 molecular chaperone [Phytobacter ursingii]GJL35742.1 fimbrial chaperone [Enterobacter hormaechei]